jgi:hypothetical protein
MQASINEPLWQPSKAREFGVSMNVECVCDDEGDHSSARAIGNQDDAGFLVFHQAL